MPLLLLVLFIAVPIAELAVIIQVGQAIGVWWTIALLIADSVLGSVLMRSQGRAVWRRFNEALRNGRTPVRDAATDSVTFAFGDASARLYGIARLGITREGSDGERRGSALALLFSGREPVAAHARGTLPVEPDAAWDAIELGGLGTGVEEPLDRWTVGFDADDG